MTTTRNRTAAAVVLGVLGVAGAYQQARATQAPVPMKKLAAPAPKMVPNFEWDDTFPKLPFPKDWIIGTVVGVDVDAKNHIWIAHRAETLNPNELELERKRGGCCIKAPHVMEFDYAGNLVQAWGGPSPTKEYDWPTAGTQSPDPNVGGTPNGMHSIFVDGQDNVWLTGTGPGDGQILKFTRQGKFLLQFGTTAAGAGMASRGSADSNSTARLNAATGVAEYLPTNEIFISDGYGNRRVAVLDRTTGKYKRHWGAFGKRPDDTTKWTYDANSPNPQFNTPHGIAVSTDGLVYLADRNNSRLQVFKVDGTYVTEKFVENHAMSGTAFGVALSSDPAQRYVYMPDGRNEKVWILERKSMDILGSFGCPGHAGGCFTTPHRIATDSRGNIYIGETWEGKRVQRFLYKGLRPQS